jgi:hypothetical protein
MLADLPALHGYTLADLERLSRLSAGTAHANAGWSITERCEIAWSGMAEALVVATEPPAQADLVAAGRQAIYRGVRADLHHHGVSKRDPLAGIGSMRAFAAYWWYWAALTSAGPEERVVDRTALAQIWTRLTERDRQALVALAVHETYRAAAEALGISYDRFKERVHFARRRFRRLWFWPDADPGCWGTDRRVANGGAQLADARSRRRLDDRRRRRGVRPDAAEATT